MNKQKPELFLIQKDVDELCAILLALKDNENSGCLLLALFPIICFVTEESHKYLTGISARDFSTSVEKYMIAIKKIRALIKMFEGKNGGRAGLINSFNVYQEISSSWMNAGKSGVKGYIGKLLQPDVGIFFLDEAPIYETFVGVSVTGEEKRSNETDFDLNFKRICDQSWTFSEAIGEYFGLLKLVFSLLGISNTEINSISIPFDLNITHNDFRSDRLFKRIAEMAQIMEPSIVPVTFFIFTQVNIAYKLLPRLLPPNSDLLLRFQFLTAYHALRSLFDIRDEIDPEFARIIRRENDFTVIQSNTKVRNVLAHYGLGDGKKFIVGESDLLDEVIRGYIGKSKIELAQVTNEQLSIISNWSNARLSKSHLGKVCALLGDHT